MVGARYDPDRRGYRIFVGNLSGVTTHDDLANFFNPFGPIVDVWLASDPPGFGFVVFKNGADADKAVSEKNSTMYLSRTIKVQHARLFRERPTRPNASYDSDTSRSPRSRSPCSRSTSRSREAHTDITTDEEVAVIVIIMVIAVLAIPDGDENVNTVIPRRPLMHLPPVHIILVHIAPTPDQNDRLLVPSHRPPDVLVQRKDVVTVVIAKAVRHQ
ncbi:hypothetical protein ACOMHN_020996 [Nucella lapillus]